MKSQFKKMKIKVSKKRPATIMQLKKSYSI
jgi:hypothetical protein